MVYTALNGVLYHVQQVTAAYGQTQNVADYWISGAGLDRSDCRVLEQIDGVAPACSPAITWEAQERGNEDVQLLVYAVADWAINTPYLVGGALPADEREMAVSDVFAAANGLSVGDSYEMLLTGTRPGPASADQRAGQKPGVPLPRQCDHADAGAGALWLRLLQPRRSERADGKQSL